MPRMTERVKALHREITERVEALHREMTERVEAPQRDDREYGSAAREIRERCSMG